MSFRRKYCNISIYRELDPESLFKSLFFKNFGDEEILIMEVLLNTEYSYPR